MTLAPGTRLGSYEVTAQIIDGEHYVTPSPNIRNQVLLGRIHFEIELFQRASPGRGRVFMAPLDVLFSKWDVVEPDLLVVAADQDILRDKNIRGAPALVVEIASPGTMRRDEQIKRLTPDDSLTTPLLEGLTIRLNELFA